MTCGIYRLTFTGTDKCYIGQSVNIEYRYTQHLYKLKNNTGSKKLQDAYYLHDDPALEILLECTKRNLDLEEKQAIEIFNSVIDGFNTYPDARGSPLGMIRARGENSPSAIYSNDKILEVFNYLVDLPQLTALEISKETEVGVATVRAVATLNQHKWLKEKYPDRYKTLENLKGMQNKSGKYDSKARGIKHSALISPTGTVFVDIPNVKQFCEEHNLTATNLGAVLNGKRKSHKGWKVCHEEPAL
jgi:hypothetical protein